MTSREMTLWSMRALLLAALLLSPVAYVRLNKGAPVGPAAGGVTGLDDHAS